MDQYGVEDIRTKISGGSYDSWMVNQLDEGVNFFNYRGYYGVSGFSNSDVDAANNGFKLPLQQLLLVELDHLLLKLSVFLKSS